MVVALVLRLMWGKRNPVLCSWESILVQPLWRALQSLKLTYSVAVLFVGMGPAVHSPSSRERDTHVSAAPLTTASNATSVAGHPGFLNSEDVAFTEWSFIQL